MRKYFSLFCLALTMMLAVVTHAQAGTMAQNIFGNIGGTATIDRGGVIHSQTRTIFSLGGGMYTVQGKQVTLMSVDPPSYSAGCSGISWHFGGFAFISVDEIRQMVEAVSQAALGVVVDLAMQTLCPQCYAVMNKLRDMANAMRNQMADACKVAQNFGALLSEKFGVGGADVTTRNCAVDESRMGGATSALDSMLTGACKTLEGAIDSVSSAGTSLNNWLNKTPLGTGQKTPTKEQTVSVGNMTYKGLTALGYPDGFAKDVLMSAIGMAIYTPTAGKSCADTALKNLYGSNAAEIKCQTAGTQSVYNNTDENKVASGSSVNCADLATTVTGSPDANNPTAVAAAASQAEATKASGDAGKAQQSCFAPPLITGVGDLYMKLVCGFKPTADADVFARKWATNVRNSSTSADALKRLSESSLGILCNLPANMAAAAVGPSPDPISSSYGTPTSKDPLIYKCKNGCNEPQLQRFSDAVGAATGEYTGLAWMIIDSLYAGVDAIVKNSPTGLPSQTIKIINGSDYPLYRVLNLAAVYPGTADDLLIAYGGLIAAHYVMDTMSQLLLPGSMPQIGVKDGDPGLTRQEILALRSEIAQMVKTSADRKDQVLNRLNEKRAMVDVIMQVNKALQAEVMSQGLAGNVNMAVSIKRQEASAGATTPAAPTSP